MNEGFIEAKENEWLIFWGSDDWAFSYNCLENLFNKINILSKKSTPDLYFVKDFILMIIIKLLDLPNLITL